MPLTPPILARAHRKLHEKMQEGTILSHTTIRSGPTPHIIALIELKDGSRILAPLTAHSSKLKACLIGLPVHPRMHLSHITPDGLRVYSIAYELCVPTLTPTRTPTFPGYILALTGPSGVGKSALRKMLVHAFADYVAPVPILTTRKRKSGDDGEYLYITLQKFSALQKSGDLVAFANLPSTSEKRWYGYHAHDIEKIWKNGKLPVVITEMHLLQGLANHYGRRSILSLGLLPPGRSKRTMLSHLLFRLRKRGRETEEQIRERLKNAIHDLTFFKNRRDLFDHLIVNEKLEKVIEKLKPHIPGLKEA